MLKYRDQVSFGYFLDSTDNFKLRDLINGINMIKPFDPIQVALMNGIHPNITGLTIRLMVCVFRQLMWPLVGF